ncbi:MAG: type II toxin-antitoxin system VapC family toxin [Myxococcota bacterium]|nr:type II toxin-antitoxin system VapC family toxin [Myxococcota bacterium]
MLLLDTCVLIYDALTPDRLSHRALDAVEEGERSGSLFISDISLWETAMLIEKKRLDPGTDALEFINLIIAARSISVLPITPEIAVRSASLTLHGDPADRLIAATAIEHVATLVTPDKALRRCAEVSTLW